MTVPVSAFDKCYTQPIDRETIERLNQLNFTLTDEKKALVDQLFVAIKSIDKLKKQLLFRSELIEQLKSQRLDTIPETEEPVEVKEVPVEKACYLYTILILIGVLLLAIVTAWIGINLWGVYGMD